MIRFLSVFIVTMSAQFVAADTIRVRSGNHSEFVRLVMYGTNSQNVDISEDVNGFTVVSNNKNDSYELNSVFNLIPRDRISRIEDQGEGRLFIELQCECTIEMFDIRQGLVLDVVDESGLVAQGGNPLAVVRTDEDVMLSTINNVATGSPRESRLSLFDLEISFSCLC